MLTAVQLVGAGLVLTAFALTQRGSIAATSPTSLILNTVGAGILAVLAVLDAQWGFFALEGIWAIVSVTGLVRHVLRPGGDVRGA